jgi:hypothetical protein
MNKDVIFKTQGNLIQGKKVIYGDAILTETSFSFNKKSAFIGALFGFIGILLSKGKQIFIVDFNDIIGVTKGQYKRNDKVLEIITKEGKYQFIVLQPDKWFELFDSIMKRKTAVKS